MGRCLSKCVERFITATMEKHYLLVMICRQIITDETHKKEGYLFVLLQWQTEQHKTPPSGHISSPIILLQTAIVPIIHVTVRLRGFTIPASAQRPCGYYTKTAHF